MTLSRSPGLEESKQARFLTKAEDIGVYCIKFYSAEKNPNDLLAEFYFLNWTLKGSLIEIGKGGAPQLIEMADQEHPCPGGRTWEILILCQLCILWMKKLRALKSKMI